MPKIPVYFKHILNQKSKNQIQRCLNLVIVFTTVIIHTIPLLKVLFLSHIHRVRDRQCKGILHQFNNDD